MANFPFSGEIISIIGSAVLGYSIEYYRSRAKIRKIRRSYQQPYQVPTKDRRNITILIGLGGSGKTNLIKTLLDNDQANPNERTENFDIYYSTYNSGVMEKIGRRTKKQKSSEQYKYWLFISDYKGQNLGTLISAFIQQQKREYSPLAYGHINSLILVVDLLAPKKKKNDPEISPQDHMDMARIKKNIEQWNETALDAVFGLLTRELEYVCLFINKVDLMTQRGHEKDQSYIEAYDELKTKMDKRYGSEVEVLLGSAQDGTNVNTLKSRLIEHSVPNNS